LGRSGYAGARRGRSQNFIVASQVALAMILLIQIAVLVRGAEELGTRPIGFDTRQLLTFRVALPVATYTQPAARSQFFQSFLERLTGIPGVAAAAAVDRLPIADEESTVPTRVDGSALQPVAELPLAARNVVSPGYVRTMRLPLLSGRDLTEADVMSDGSPVALVSEAAVRRFWPEQNPLGRRLGFASASGVDQWLTVVGVVGDVRNSDADQAPLPQVYLPATSIQRPEMAVVVRAVGTDPLALVPVIRSEITRLDPNLPIHDVATMERVVFNDLVGTWVLMALLGGVAFVALCLAAAGIYGVVSYTVTQRTREIGLRMALGAAPRAVRRMVVLQGSLPVTAGGAVGLAIAIGMAFATAGGVPEIDVRSPMTYGIVVLGLALTTVIASYLPARRASRVDPAVTLRGE
jgi:putative ABC transport system permease protein